MNKYIHLNYGLHTLGNLQAEICTTVTNVLTKQGGADGNFVTYIYLPLAARWDATAETVLRANDMKEKL